jgi:hypothetical protein
MKRSITRLGMTLGSASLIALGVGCSHDNRPAQAPATGTSSPPFESNVPPSPAPAPPPPPNAPEPGMETPPPPHAAMPNEPNAPPPPPGAPGGMEQAAGDNEKQLCDALATSANVHAEDAQNGATIVAIPKRGHDIATVRDDARRLQTSLSRRAPSEGIPSGETCGLYSAARLPGVDVSISEGTGDVRIMMTTTNPAEVRDVRRIARDQANAMRRMR